MAFFSRRSLLVVLAATSAMTCDSFSSPPSVMARPSTVVSLLTRVVFCYTLPPHPPPVVVILKDDGKMAASYVAPGRGAGEPRPSRII